MQAVRLDAHADERRLRNLVEERHAHVLDRIAGHDAVLRRSLWSVRWRLNRQTIAQCGAGISAQWTAGAGDAAVPPSRQGGNDSGRLG